MSDANLGDGANGRLSEEERARLDFALAGRSGCPTVAIPEVVESIVREHTERAWDEAVRECHDLGWMHDFARSDALDRNPYRAAREEQS